MYNACMHDVVLDDTIINILIEQVTYFLSKPKIKTLALFTKLLLFNYSSSSSPESIQKVIKS